MEIEIGHCAALHNRDTHQWPVFSSSQTGFLFERIKRWLCSQTFFLLHGAQRTRIAWDCENTFLSRVVTEGDNLAPRGYYASHVPEGVESGIIGKSRLFIKKRS